MSQEPPPQRIPPQRFAIITALVGLAVAVGFFVLVANNLGSGGSDTQTEDDTDTELFVAGQASVLADAVRRDGPLLLPDLLGGSRDIFLQNLGGSEWRAFESHPPGTGRQCVLRWVPDQQVFADSCGPTTYPADGTGLVNYAARVDRRGRVVVDLRTPASSSTTVASDATPSTSPG